MRAQRLGLGLAAPLGQRLGEVGEQHREPQPERHRADEACGRSPWPNSAWSHSTVVSALPTSTTNMTGLRAIQRGFSLTNDARMARCTTLRRMEACFLS